MDLVPFIYHEKQEAGSQLCAQHCLNNLLQQFCYSEFDLADIAQKLDQAENATLAPRNQNTKSYNLDDTGFFSISVLETALQVWDLTLVRWRGEAMRQYQDHPEEQSAFILNLSSHWFPLRRFSPQGSQPIPTFTRRWYNLNSFLSEPEWISPMYLSLVLRQAEEEGYSVFVVRRAGAHHPADEGVEDPQPDAEPGEGEGWGDGGIGALPESQADVMAVELGEPAGRGGAVTQDYEEVAQAGPSRSNTMEDDPSLPETHGAGSGRRRRRQEDLTSPFIEPQDMAPAPSSGRSTPRPRNRPSRSGRSSVPDVFDNQHTTFPDLDDDVEDYRLEAAGEDLFDDHHDHDHDDAEVSHDAESGATSGVGIAGAQPAGPRWDAYAGPTDFAFQSRSYDDEDEALQAALKASMAELPPDFVLPELKPLNQPARRPAEARAEGAGAGPAPGEIEGGSGMDVDIQASGKGGAGGQAVPQGDAEMGEETWKRMEMIYPRKSCPQRKSVVVVSPDSNETEPCLDRLSSFNPIHF